MINRLLRTGYRATTILASRELSRSVAIAGSAASRGIAIRVSTPSAGQPASGQVVRAKREGDLLQRTDDEDASKRSRIRVPVIMASGKVIATQDIALSELELQIFDVLRKAAASRGLPTVIRVAGGWVRDKVLGRENHDIDIALDDSTGEAFANVVNEYLSSTGQETHSVNVIQANPEQSKHLETATVNVLGMQLDFVNLRAEEYAADSRIPTARFGTAQEDALRRDFTINALFFNVNSNSIEDLTGHGFQDLKAGILRTPLTPVTTLLDDPLRVLRAVRFASRFGFALAPDLGAALELPEVWAALAAKVSRERIGSEVEGMLGSARPVGALRMLQARGLLPVVLSPPRMCSKAAAEAAASTVKEAKGRKRGGRTTASSSSSSPTSGVGGVAPRSGVELEASAEASLVQWLLEPEPFTDEPSSQLLGIIEDGMLIVDAVDVLAATVDSSGGSSEAEAWAMERATIQEKVEGAEPVDVVTGTGLDDEDAARATDIASERAARDGDVALAPEVQQLPDHLGHAKVLTEDKKRIILLSALTWPLRAAWSLGVEGKELGKPLPAPSAVLRHRLRRRARDCTGVASVHEAACLWVTAAEEADKAGLDASSELAPLRAAAQIAAASSHPPPASSLSQSSSSSSSPSSAAAETTAAVATGASRTGSLAIPEEVSLSDAHVALPGALKPITMDLSEAKRRVGEACEAARVDSAKDRARIAFGLAVQASKSLLEPSALCACAVACAVRAREAVKASPSSSSSAASDAADAADALQGAGKEGEGAERAERLELLRSIAADGGVSRSYERLRELVRELGLEDAARWKPLVDGKELRAMGVTPGPGMRVLMEAQMAWRMAHPSASQEECKAAMQGWLQSS